jgi:hypothetical protein
MTARQDQLKQMVTVRQAEVNQARVRKAQTRPAATYNADGTVTRSGGTAERPRGRLANSGQPSGSRVATAEGQVLGQARADNSDIASQVRILQQDLATAVSTIPMQVGTGDPNAASVLARYDADTFYDTDSGTFWRWFSDSESDPALPEWVVINQLLQGFTGDPNDQGGSPIPVYVDGAKAIRDDGTEFTGAVSGDTWTGEISDFNGVFGATEDGTYTLITNSTKALKVLAVTTSGAATLTLNPTVGNTISAGGTLTGTVGSADGNPLYFTVRLETV